MSIKGATLVKLALTDWTLSCWLLATLDSDVQTQTDLGLVTTPTLRTHKRPLIAVVACLSICFNLRLRTIITQNLNETSCLIKKSIVKKEDYSRLLIATYNQPYQSVFYLLCSNRMDTNLEKIQRRKLLKVSIF